MAYSAVGCQTEKYARRSLGAVARVENKIFLRDKSAFIGSNVAAVKTGGDQLIESGIGQQIAGQLFDGKLVEGHVAIEGIDDPIAIGPHFAVVVEMDAVGIGV